MEICVSVFARNMGHNRNTLKNFNCANSYELVLVNNPAGFLFLFVFSYLSADSS